MRSACFMHRKFVEMNLVRMMPYLPNQSLSLYNRLLRCDKGFEEGDVVSVALVVSRQLEAKREVMKGSGTSAMMHHLGSKKASNLGGLCKRSRSEVSFKWREGSAYLQRRWIALHGLEEQSLR